MDYLQLINKCLVELNYKQVYAFAELTKNDHKKIKSILNVLNAEICSYDRWNFLLREARITLSANAGEIANPVNGRIAALIIDNIKLGYTDDFEKFFINSQPANTYTTFNDKILLPRFGESKTVKILYYTKDYAVSAEGAEKPEMEEGADCSLIPAPFAEPLLVYGACMRLKGNPKHVRFNYWYSMYKEALANMRSKISVNAHEAPSVKLFRN
ncbi:MAG: hypothetical protein LBK53_08085 [Heliobacteriaceae bacterium]|jgi:hypothetical protein|nr:hypothetical protein [Heliobacteriaceae bacterium]